MTSFCRVAVLVMLATTWSPANVSAQAADAPSGASIVGDGVVPEARVETIEVIGQREALRKQVQAFVTDLTASDGDFVARWNRPACLWLSGIPAEQAAYLRSRIASVARSARVPFDGADSCHANLYVFVTDQPQRLLTRLKSQNPRLFGSGSPLAAQSLLDSAHPVRVWYESRLLNADGSPPVEGTNEAPQFRLENSKIVGGVAENLSSTIVVVDARRIARVSLTQIADYVAMVAFARVDLVGRAFDRRTILGLFDASDPASTAPELTDWDLAFLRALYGTEQANKEHRRLIVGDMTRNLAGRVAD